MGLNNTNSLTTDGMIPKIDGINWLVGEGFFTTKVEKLVKWARKFSLYPMPFGTACCAIEYMALVGSHYDVARFGAEIVRFSPRQSDLIIVAGTISCKLAPVLKQIYEQMCAPKWVISMGACASSGGFYDNYATLQGIDKIIPVDVYVAGCPPRPESLVDAILSLHKKIEKEKQSQIAK